MLMITSSPAPDSASSVTSVWRLSCQLPTTLALSRTLVHAVLNVVTGRVGSFGCPLPAGNTYHSTAQAARGAGGPFECQRDPGLDLADGYQTNAHRVPIAAGPT